MWSTNSGYQILMFQNVSFLEHISAWLVQTDKYQKLYSIHFCGYVLITMEYTWLGITSDGH